MSAYQKLETRFRRLGALDEAADVLSWDSAAIMPSGGAAARSEQLATLRLIAHEMLEDEALGDLLGEADGQNDLEPWQRANLREMGRRWQAATALPGRLVEALSKAASACEMVWRTAWPANDFAAVLPSLETLLALVRESAVAKGERLGKTPYDALLDEYEPDATAREIDGWFATLAERLPPLLDAVLERQGGLPAALEPAGPFPVERQRALGVSLMGRLGFEFGHGRLDVSAHPFCGGTPDDVRITTRYKEDDFGRALMGVLHETGHALYERGLPADWRRQPVGRARGMVLHESQSLLVEMQVCRSRAFLRFASPLIRDAFDGSGAVWEADNLYRLNTRVQRSLIRVDADEVTYPLHVILRYRLERAMLAGELAARDLPEAWRQGMTDLVGAAPPDDRHGCLQDIHWYSGGWGYFPTYTLGAMAAAQLFDAARRADPAIEAGIAEGDFQALLAWLRANVHGRASSVSTAEILTAATGRPLGPEVYLRHLERRYLDR